MLRIDVELSDHEHDERNVTKKANKPLMEKRRRARINRCLFEMKQMLVDSITTGVYDRIISPNSPGQSKWEKADILEMSVAYMRQLQKQTLQTGIEDPLGSSQFIEGFSECLKEVEKFNAANTLPSAVQEHNARLSDHLTVRLQTLVENPRPKVAPSIRCFCYRHIV
ncbi:unnamed protein product [Toxocara canis]|uniref:BHLH domain-containing protein n=1 Tax=Toxocara canis TaxID=6265 RepID=A0A183V481_TOXCA|nr:unnamed protein product [Toxocara canis]